MSSDAAHFETWQNDVVTAADRHAFAVNRGAPCRALYDSARAPLLDAVRALYLDICNMDEDCTRHMGGEAVHSDEWRALDIARGRPRLILACISTLMVEHGIET